MKGMAITLNGNIVEGELALFSSLPHGEFKVAIKPGALQIQVGGKWYSEEELENHIVFSKVCSLREKEQKNDNK